MCLSVFKSEAFRARVRARERERARNRDKQSERGTRGRESGTEGGRGEKGKAELEERVNLAQEEGYQSHVVIAGNNVAKGGETLLYSLNSNFIGQ